MNTKDTKSSGNPLLTMALIGSLGSLFGAPRPPYQPHREQAGAGQHPPPAALKPSRVLLPEPRRRIKPGLFREMRLTPPRAA